MRKTLSFILLFAFCFTMVLGINVFADSTKKTTVELAAASENGVINAVQGTTVSFNVILSLPDYSDVNAKAFVYTKYIIDANGKSTYDKQSQADFQTFDYKPLTFNVSLTISQDYSSGDVDVPISIHIVNMGSSYFDVVDNTPDYISVHVTPSDTTAPVVKITSPVNNGYYNTSTLPVLPEYTVIEANRYTTAMQGWDTSEGTHTLTVTATDLTGNVGSDSVMYTVDNTPPSITSKIVEGGIYNAATLQSLGTYYDAQDANLDSVTGSELFYTEGNHTATITASDKAGNSVSQTINYIVDNRAPTITFNFDNGGFYTSGYLGALNPYYDVFDEHPDPSSDIAPALDLSEGNHSVIVQATDKAGNINSSTASYTVDDTPPTITFKLDPTKYYNEEALNALGDYYDVFDANLLNVTASDLEKKVDGVHTVTVTATDKAGNETTESISYNVDNTAPVITFSSILSDGGFYKSSVLQPIINSFYTATDANLLDVYDTGLILTEGQHTVTVTAIDKAGNTTTKSISYIIDDTPPTISFIIPDNSSYTTAHLIELLNGASYFSTNDVNGVTSVVSDELQTSEGIHTLTVRAADAAGNVSSASVTYTVDNTAPIIEITTPSDGGLYELNQNVLANWTATDALSGIAFAIGTAACGAAIDTSSVGPKTFTVTAVDNAGNAAAKTVSYTVFSFNGILQPINSDGSSVFKQGSTIPVKFQLMTSNNMYLANLTNLRVAITDKGSTPTGSINEDAAASGASNSDYLFRYDVSSNQYIYNLSTKGFTSNHVYRVSIKMMGSSGLATDFTVIGYAEFKLK